MGKETTSIYKQNTGGNGYYIVSELNDVLQSSYYFFPLG